MQLGHLHATVSDAPTRDPLRDPMQSATDVHTDLVVRSAPSANVSSIAPPHQDSLIEPPPTPKVYTVVTAGDSVGVFDERIYIDVSRILSLPFFSMRRFQDWNVARYYYAQRYYANEVFLVPTGSASTIPHPDNISVSSIASGVPTATRIAGISNDTFTDSVSVVASGCPVLAMDVDRPDPFTSPRLPIQSYTPTRSETATSGELYTTTSVASPSSRSKGKSRAVTHVVTVNEGVSNSTKSNPVPSHPAVSGGSFSRSIHSNANGPKEHVMPCAVLDALPALNPTSTAPVIVVSAVSRPPPRTPPQKNTATVSLPLVDSIDKSTHGFLDVPTTPRSSSSLKRLTLIEEAIASINSELSPSPLPTQASSAGSLKRLAGVERAFRVTEAASGGTSRRRRKTSVVQPLEPRNHPLSESHSYIPAYSSSPESEYGLSDIEPGFLEEASVFLEQVYPNSPQC